MKTNKKTVTKESKKFKEINLPYKKISFKKYEIDKIGIENNNTKMEALALFTSNDAYPQRRVVIM